MVKVLYSAKFVCVECGEQFDIDDTLNVEMHELIERSHYCFVTLETAV